MWFRVDNRLIHGQVIEGWLPYTNARHLVVANDELAQDSIRQTIMQMAVPRKIDVRFVCVADLATTIKSLGDGNVLVLYETCDDVRGASEAGVAMDVLNIGNLHYADGKIQLYPHVALSSDDIATLRTLASRGTAMDFRAVPTQSVKAPQEPLF
ncbi:MAG: PTS sugar transporter subunit IIB [Desulfovibrio sp.]|nr:PTS sugar transporter subunit IIB [Desulfovibrio sp.]